MGRVRLAAVAVTILICLGGIPAGAANAPDEPDLQAMALAVTDFDGGAAIYRQGFTTPQAPIVAEYERYFKPGAHLAGRRLLYAGNVDFSLDDAGTTQLVFTALVAQLRTSSGRAQVTSSLSAAVKRNTGGKVRVKSASASAPVALSVGQGGFRMTIVLRTSVGRVEVALTGVRVDRAIGLIELAAYPRSRLTTGPSNLATARLAKRFLAGFVLHNTTLPTIVGAPQQGQALTADPGHWAGGPGSFTYQWNRCTAACAPIAGAVGQTYIPTAADSSARLSVTVTAGNSVSQSSATSNMVGPVP